MSTTTSPTDRAPSGLADALTAEWRSASRTSWRARLEFIAPRIEDDDLRFRRTINRLSTIGLRAIAGVCLGASVLWAVFGSIFFPQSLEGFGAVALAGMCFVGFATLLLSFWPPARARARWLGLVALTVLPLLDLLASTSVPITSGERWAFLSASIILMMLIAIASLPVRPLQMAAFGIVLLGIYALAVVKTGASLVDTTAASVALVFLAMTLFTCTGLTIIVYYQRVAAYRARLSAERAFEELRAAQVRVNVSENAASQSRFAAALSHELNTPLGSLTSAFDTVVHAHEREHDHPEMRERLDAVWRDAERSGRESASRLRETVERMKRLTNLDRAEQQIADINELWRDTTALLSAEIERTADVELALAPIAPIRCRPHQIGAVFSNLLRNAAAAMEGRGLIRVSSVQRGGDVIIEVRDNGRGMPEAQLHDLFNPSFHIDGARVATTNWGLFVCRAIVTEHDGVIEIESEEGVGTTVRVVLPASMKIGP